MNIKNEIRKLSSLSELNDLSSFISECKTMLGKSTLGVGSKVWCVQKTKKTPGVIKKIMQSRCLVKMRDMTYRVPMSMLELKVA